MISKGNLSLPELAARYHISEVYGASVAYFSSEESGIHDLRAYSNRISCYELQLIREGEAHVSIGENSMTLREDDLLVLTPFQPVDCLFPEGVVTEGLLIESSLYDDLSQVANDIPMRDLPSTSTFVYHLSEKRAVEFSGILQQIRRAIRMGHIYKLEMIRSLVHVCLLFLNELPYDENILTNDFRHKENIYKIFLHLAHNNFRQERQVQFYADKLNITSTYLSRIVREISGNTVGWLLNLLTFNEACNLLKSTDKTIGEISIELNFSDQAAFTNFFKQHAHMPPNTYRKEQQGKLMVT